MHFKSIKNIQDLMCKHLLTPISISAMLQPWVLSFQAISSSDILAILHAFLAGQMVKIISLTMIA
jgi:hypothetical protein